MLRYITVLTCLAVSTSSLRVTLLGPRTDLEKVGSDRRVPAPTGPPEPAAIMDPLKPDDGITAALTGLALAGIGHLTVALDPSKPQEANSTVALDPSKPQEANSTVALDPSKPQEA
eukprot:Selendium_serpulae@DN12220_c0_g1_i1.p1